MQNDSENIYNYQPLWGKWLVNEMIGSGNFGKVYRISHVEYGHTYTSAVKIISIPSEEQYIEAATSVGSNEVTLKNYFHEMIQGLVNEVNILYSLSGNSNILGYHDHKIIEHKNKVGWDILIRMEFVKPLSKYLKEKMMTLEEVINLGIDICSALDVCSKHGIIHRDIKDANIFISEDNIFKLGDFGIAYKLSKSGWTASMKGTPQYMAPEVYRGDHYDASVDIYSLGIVMYKLLNHNRLPFMPQYPDEIVEGDSKISLEKRMHGEQFQTPDQAGEALSKVILKASSYRSQDRYTSPLLMKKELEKVLNNLPILTKNRSVTISKNGANLYDPTSKSPIIEKNEQNKDTKINN